MFIIRICPPPCSSSPVLVAIILMCVVFRYGRVNYVLAKRLELLDEVSRLQKSLGVQGDVAFTCETARYLTAKLFINYFLGILVRMVLQRSS